MTKAESFMGKVEKFISLMRDINKSISFPDSSCKEKNIANIH